jgi:hypothetical protein
VCLQDVYLHPRKQRRDHFKGRILRRRADQQNIPRFHVRQKRVLLRAIEPVHFIDKHDRPRAVMPRRFRTRHYFLDFLDARHYRAERNEFGLRAASDHTGESRLPAPRRTPEEHRCEIVALNLNAQRLAGSKKVFLPDEFIERLRTHPIRERTPGERFFFGLDGAKQAHG